MKTFGIIWPNGTKELCSILEDNNGKLLIEESIRPYPYTEEWVEPIIIPLVKIEKPVEGNWESKLVWFNDRVERQWVLT